MFKSKFSKYDFVSNYGHEISEKAIEEAVKKLKEKNFGGYSSLLERELKYNELVVSARFVVHSRALGSYRFKEDYNLKDLTQDQCKSMAKYISKIVTKEFCEYFKINHIKGIEISRIRVYEHLYDFSDHCSVFIYFLVCVKNHPKPKSW